MARLPYPEPETLPPDIAEAIAKRSGLNVFRALALSPKLAGPFMKLSGAVLGRNSLDGQLRELAILRVGHRYAAPYELHHHTRIGRSEGMREALIEAARTGPATPGLSEAERLILDLTDEILAEGALTEAGFRRAAATLSSVQVADLVMTVGFFVMVCMFLNSVQVDIEQP